MNIYDATRPGTPLTTQTEQDSLRQESQFQGFFSRVKLEDLLDQPDCVGLRFYNAGGLAAGQRQLIGVGVTADGSELRLNSGKGYFISAPAIGDPELRLTKTAASAAVNDTQNSRTGADKERFRFSSFFSKTAITRLLGPSATDIRFYIVDLNATFQTHLGVSSDGAAPVAAPGSQLPVHIVSDNPCPSPTGGCATVDPPQPGTAQPAMDTTKYLVIW